MIPLRVHGNEKRFSFSFSILVILTVIQLMAFIFLPDSRGWVDRFGLVPIRWWSDPSWEMLGSARQISALFTYAYIHADWFHCLSNLWWLWVFTPLVQSRFGALAAVTIYTCAGFAGGAVYVVFWPQSASALVGASANISGILGVYLLGCRDARIRLLGFKTLVPARYFVPFFLMTQCLLTYLYMPSSLGIAFGSHVMGCLVGAFVSLSYTARESSHDQEIAGST